MAEIERIMLQWNRACLLPVSRRHDVGLHRVIGVVRRVAGGDDALVEGANGGVAVVTADAQDDGAYSVGRCSRRGWEWG